MESPDVMTVGDLIEVLSQFDHELPIVTAVDDEGNAYRALVYTPEGVYKDDDVWWHFEDLWTEYSWEEEYPEIPFVANCVVIG